jgi:hypothetical protein
MNQWATSYVMSALASLCEGREIDIQPAKDVVQDESGRRTLMVDVHLR